MAKAKQKQIKIGLLGAGTVGGGVILVLNQNRQLITERVGAEICIQKVLARHPEKVRALDASLATTDKIEDIVNDPEIDIVVELMGREHPALEYMEAALRAGKNVVTANKDVVATHGKELFELAAANHVDFLFEAAVAGGIPIIRPLKESLAANKINKIMGIINGTTNYMLTKMTQDHMDFAEVLKEAQEKGYAESDPTADVGGFDAARKIAILASIAFNSRVTIDDVHAEGIRHITPLDLEIAKDMGYCVKLLALAHRTDEGVDVRVHPTMLPLSHQLATVDGVYNAIYVTGDAVGETMFFGEGAGAGPAASAVMGDVLEVARHVTLGVGPLVGCTCTDELPIVPMDDLKTKYYIRFKVADRSGVLAAMAGVFAKHNVSVYSVVQRGKKESGQVDLVYVTHTAREKSVRDVLAEIAELDDVLRDEPSVIRVEE